MYDMYCSNMIYVPCIKLRLVAMYSVKKQYFYNTVNKNQWVIIDPLLVCSYLDEFVWICPGVVGRYKGMPRLSQHDFKDKEP